MPDLRIANIQERVQVNLFLKWKRGRFMMTKICDSTAGIPIYSSVHHLEWLFMPL